MGRIVDEDIIADPGIAFAHLECAPVIGGHIADKEVAAEQCSIGQAIIIPMGYGPAAGGGIVDERIAADLVIVRFVKQRPTTAADGRIQGEGVTKYLRRLTFVEAGDRAAEPPRCNVVGEVVLAQYYRAIGMINRPALTGCVGDKRAAVDEESWL